MITSFIISLFIFIIIGVLSTIANKNSNEDYLLASSSVKPWLAGLSAVATNNSGYMFIGMIGYTYMYGISSIWLMIGWVFGDFVASLFVHRKLRIITENKQVLSFAGALSKWGDFNYTKLRAYLGFVTLVFLGVYAAAQLAAGSKALNVLLGWNYEVGAIIGAIIVLLYCFAGGIRASIWTDAAQSFVMIFAMGLLFITSFDKIGGFGALNLEISQIPNYSSLFPHDLPLGSFTGPFLFVLGWFITGFGVAGQPHIMVRFMAMDDEKNMNRVRAYYYGFYLAFYILTILVGISARILLPDVNGFDPELALPTLASQTLSPVLVGIILAGIFAATMSTADSQILSCTAAITRDFKTRNKPSYIMTKISTIFVTMTALAIALFGTKSVFSLVIIAWSALASSFVPLFMIYIFRGRPSERSSILIAIAGVATMLAWRYFELDQYIYEAAPGIISGLLIYLASLSLRAKRSNPEK